MISIKSILLNSFVILSFLSCTNDKDLPEPNNPATAERATIDRFSEEHGTLMVRTADNGMPEAGIPIQFDQAPFLTQSLGPDGQVVKYYNFDVQPLIPIPIYVLYKASSETPFPDQLNIIDVLPGELTYSDFWQMYIVTVPDDYIANTISSYQDILDYGYSVEKTNTIVNCPVAPYGSTANTGLNGEANKLHSGWYKNKIVYYFSFEEKALTTDKNDLVPISPIYVTFNINPDANNPNSGPASGFVTEAGTSQTHNVIATIPSDNDYSPQWAVYIYDNADFNHVNDLESAKNSTILMENAMYVNCPVVYVAE